MLTAPAAFADTLSGDDLIRALSEKGNGNELAPESEAECAPGGSEDAEAAADRTSRVDPLIRLGARWQATLAEANALSDRKEALHQAGRDGDKAMAQKAARAAWDRLDAIEHEMRAMNAATLDGLIAQMRVLQDACCEERTEALAERVFDGLLRIRAQKYSLPVTLNGRDSCARVDDPIVRLAAESDALNADCERINDEIRSAILALSPDDSAALTIEAQRVQYGRLLKGAEESEPLYAYTEKELLERFVRGRALTAGPAPETLQLSKREGALLDQLRASHARASEIEERAGITALDAKLEAVCEKLGAVSRQIRGTVPTSAAGALVQAKMLRIEVGLEDQYASELADKLVEWLEALQTSAGLTWRSIGELAASDPASMLGERWVAASAEHERAVLVADRLTDDASQAEIEAAEAALCEAEQRLGAVEQALGATTATTLAGVMAQVRVVREHIAISEVERHIDQVLAALAKLSMPQVKTVVGVLPA